jgi:formylglycine-generating enzyme required for sulfatase activity
VGPVRGFFIDRYEASDRRYNRCVEHGSCTPIRWKGCIDWQHVPADGKSEAKRIRIYLDSRPDWYNGGEEPAVCLDSAQAEAFCQWAGGRLPTEDEWTAAAQPADWESWYPFDGWTAQLDDSGKPTGRTPKTNVCGTECGFPDNRQKLTDHHERLAPVTAYPEGESKAGVRNMVGNVWEWVARCRPQNEPCLKGGAWNSTLKNETWRFATYRHSGRFVSAGIRCAYDR